MAEDLILDITGMGQRGAGSVHLSDRDIFVPFALPGERVRVAPSGTDAELLEVLTPSTDRIEPECIHFGTCGGCQLQHWRTEPYRAWKRGLVVKQLSRAGFSVDVGELVDAHGRGRRRATLHVANGRAGFAMRQSHDLVDIAVCPVLSPALAEAPAIARAAGAIIGACDAAFTETDTGIDLALIGRPKRRPDLAPLARRFGIARITLNGEVVVLQRQPELAMGPARVRLPPASFLQATARGEEVLADLVLGHLGAAKRVADLFSGLGPFALRIAARARVFAADSDAAAIAACDAALRATPGLKLLGTARRDLFRDPLVAEELNPFDAVVIDPPRAGAAAQMRELARSKVGRVIAVSCDPQSFARDAAILAGGGYSLESVTPVDQFLWTPHVELVALFRR